MTQLFFIFGFPSKHKTELKLFQKLKFYSRLHFACKILPVCAQSLVYMCQWHIQYDDVGMLVCAPTKAFSNMTRGELP